jgi:hypothetical protein
MACWSFYMYQIVNLLVLSNRDGESVFWGSWLSSHSTNVCPVGNSKRDRAVWGVWQICPAFPRLLLWWNDGCLLQITFVSASWEEAVLCGAVRCGAVRCGAVRWGAVRCGAVLCCAVLCGALLLGLVRARWINVLQYKEFVLVGCLLNEWPVIVPWKSEANYVHYIGLRSLIRSIWAVNPIQVFLFSINSTTLSHVPFPMIIWSEANIYATPIFNKCWLV